MRILVLTSSYPTSVEVAASAFLQDWVNAFCARGHEVTVIAPCDRHHAAHVNHAGRLTVSYFQYLADRRWQTLAYGAGMYDNVFRNPFRVLQLLPFLREQHGQAQRYAGSVDVMHAHWLFPAGLVGAMVKRETGRPLVVTIHSTDLHLMRKLPGGRLLTRAIVRQADCLHFVTEYHRQRFAQWVGPKAMAEVGSY